MNDHQRPLWTSMVSMLEDFKAGFNALLSTDKRLSRGLIHRRSSPQTIAPNVPSYPSTEPPAGQAPSGGK
jgi:hypothetical protein